jgi:hypothetical protein
MKRHLALLLTLTVLGTLPLAAQREREQHGAAPRPQAHPRANQGHLPQPPAARRGGQPEPERWEGGRVNAAPHVNHDRWG